MLLSYKFDNKILKFILDLDYAVTLSALKTDHFYNLFILLKFLIYFHISL